MELLNIYGVLCAIVIGFVLGLTGAGGSILTVPVLVYVLNIIPVTATAYSLFIVGVSSFVGTLRNLRNHTINFNIAYVFAVPSLISVFLTRKYFVPYLPEIIYQTNSFSLSKDFLIMTFFAVLMLFSSISMIRGVTYNNFSERKFNKLFLFFEGIIIGFATGFVGAGGGFLIVPTLVIFANIPIKNAISTSLLIISIKSLLGFLGDIGNVIINWEFLICFSLVSVIGIIIGIWLSSFINGNNLKRLFGYFILIMSITIILKESFT